MYEAVFHRSGDLVRRPPAPSITGSIDAFLARCQPQIDAAARQAKRLAHDTRHRHQRHLIDLVTAGRYRVEDLDSFGTGRGDRHNARVVGRYLRRLAWVQQLTSEAA